MVVVDTNVLNCLLSAMRDGDIPRRNDALVRDEQVATFRLYLWEGLGGVGRVAVDEVAKHPHEEKREWLQSIISTQLPEVRVEDEDMDEWKARAAELRKHHGGELDCRLVAEAEIVGASTLVSLDKKMIRALRRYAKIDLQTPTECWAALGIPKGTPPKWTPAASNPLSAATFWRWQ
jgi:predicted nucleic-acid-binding protein